MTTRAVRLRSVGPGQADGKENTMTLNVPVLITVVVAIVIIVVISVLETRHDGFAEACAAAGGIPFQPRNASVCLNPGAVIKLK